jgi:hypothetical protein
VAAVVVVFGTQVVVVQEDYIEMILRLWQQDH